MPLVVKYGGNAMVDEQVRSAVAATIASEVANGRELIVVHGGGPFIERELELAGIKSPFIRGLRVTPIEAMEPLERALTLLGKRLAQEIGNAVGLTGRDCDLLVANTFDPELGQVGRMAGVNDSLLRGLLRLGVTPVVACLALDPCGSPLNVNADEVAAAVAGALHAPVVFLTNVAGVLADPQDPQSRLPRLTDAQVREGIASGIISGGMIPKVEAALACLTQGASSAVIADGRTETGLQDALAGTGGTEIVQDRPLGAG